MSLRVDADLDYYIFNRSAASLPERWLSSVSLGPTVRPLDFFLRLTEYAAAIVAIAVALPTALFLVPSKRRLALRLCLASLALFGGFALLTVVYFGALFASYGFNPDFLDIDSCLDDGGIWNYQIRACEHCRHCP